MPTLDEKILILKEQIKNCKSLLETQFLIEDDTEYQEQLELELRWHIQDLEEELNKLLEQNRFEEWIEGWG